MKIYIIAGEVSGDQLGARLLADMRHRLPQADIRGIGGELMAEQGLESLFPIREFAIMGLVEVIRHIPRLKRRMRRIADDIRAFDPDILLTVDSPGLSLRIHKMFDAPSFKRVHLVAPSVWAWKPWRAKKMAAYLDLLLVNLPFEPPYFTVHGLDTRYIGHPVTELFALADPSLIDAYLPASAVGKRLVVLAPGSRSGEVAKLLPDFLRVAQQLYSDDPQLFFLVPTVETVEAQVRAQMADSAVPHQVVTGQALRWSAFARADLALVASGTIALELGMMRVPTIIAYRIHPVTAAIVRRLSKVRFASLVNLLKDRAIQPELLQQDFTPERMITEARRFLYDAEARDAYKREADDIAAMLMAPQPGETPSSMAVTALQSLRTSHR